ncbi:MAG: SPOR domain-containing protein [Burkholderiales bacterium]|nr:SPOR domain-containing protein [Burkholderiales bacterium]
MATRASPPARKRAGGSEDGDVDPALPQKKRARHRLIGAIALCLLAAIVVPLLLDSEPKRPSSDVAIVIPSRDTPLPARVAEVKPVDAKGGDTKSGDVKEGDAKSTDSKSADAKSADSKGSDAKSADAKAADPKPADPKSAKAEPRKDGKDEIAQLADAAQARAKGEGRYLLQVGAYANESGAATAVERVQATGLRAFTEKIKTDRGDRVRVRVGPFTSRDAAEQARTQLQAAGVQAAMISP